MPGAPDNVCPDPLPLLPGDPGYVAAADIEFVDDAAVIVREAAETISKRASERDREGGERSMAATVKAFNGLTGHVLTETEGWLFMVCLKAARSLGGNFKRDDYVDGAAYFGLAGEAAGRQ